MSIVEITAEYPQLTFRTELPCLTPVSKLAVKQVIMPYILPLMCGVAFNSEQQYFEIEKRFADSQDRFVSQTQELKRLKEEFAKNGKCGDFDTADMSRLHCM